MLRIHSHHCMRYTRRNLPHGAPVAKYHARLNEICIFRPIWRISKQCVQGAQYLGDGIDDSSYTQKHYIFHITIYDIVAPHSAPITNAPIKNFRTPIVWLDIWLLKEGCV